MKCDYLPRKIANLRGTPISCSEKNPTGNQTTTNHRKIIKPNSSPFLQDFVPIRYLSCDNSLFSLKTATWNQHKRYLNYQPKNYVFSVL